MPLVGYGVYRLVASGSAPDSRRRILAAALAGYVGINVAALLVGLTLGQASLLIGRPREEKEYVSPNGGSSIVFANVTRFRRCATSCLRRRNWRSGRVAICTITMQNDVGTDTFLVNDMSVRASRRPSS